jgi:hypothetical protein
MHGLYLNSPNMPSWHGAKLKHRDNFTFTLLLTFIQIEVCKAVILHVLCMCEPLLHTLKGRLYESV